MSTTRARHRVQASEEVVGVAVARKHAIEIEGEQRPAVDGGVAALRIEDVAVAARELGGDRQRDVAEQPRRGHDPPDILVQEPVALGVVGDPIGDGIEELGQIGRVHLAVAGHDHGGVDAQRQRLSVARDDRRPDAAVQDVPRHVEALAVPVGLADGAGHGGGGVQRGVVDDDHIVDPGGDPGDGLTDGSLFIEGRHDDRHA